MPRRLWLIVRGCAAVMVATAVASCSAGTGTSTLAMSSPPTATPAARPTRSPEEQSAAGLVVFREQYCATCHTLDSADAVSIFGPSHNQLATTAARRILDDTYSGTAKSAEAYIRESITDPRAYVVPGYENTNMPMPPFRLSEDELTDLVQMLMLQQ